MCFSASASFATSAVLFLSGSYAVFKAIKNDKRYIYLALIPLIFALQQALEGVVWLDSHHRFFSLAYLFFAYFFWPPFIAFSIYQIEDNIKIRKSLFWIGIFSFLIGLILYTPLILNFVSLTALKVQHSICYDINLPDRYIKILAILYLGVLLFSTFISSQSYLKIFGTLLFISYALTYLFYHYAFTSVWCFFGAIISIFIIFIIPKKVHHANHSMD